MVRLVIQRGQAVRWTAPAEKPEATGDWASVEGFRARVSSATISEARPYVITWSVRDVLSRSKRFRFHLGTADDAPALAALHTAVAENLTQHYGPGAWSTKTSEKGVLHALRTSRVFVAREGSELVATLRLASKKPWAIDVRYFSACSRPLYLLAMAVATARQRAGIGRKCLEEATRAAREWPADAVRLDAFDAEAGAGVFYARCGWSEVGRTTYRNSPLIYYEFLLK
jgi:GNAT superfamily N-acetyltransferase